MSLLAFWGTEFYKIPKVVKYVEDMIFSQIKNFKFQHRMQTCILCH